MVTLGLVEDGEDKK